MKFTKKILLKSSNLMTIPAGQYDFFVTQKQKTLIL